MRSLRTARIPGGALLASVLLGFGLCASAFADVTITVSELGTGTLVGPGGTLNMPGAAAADPGPGGQASVLSFPLLNPPDLVPGDVQLVQGGVVTDIIRFVPAGTGNPAYPASLLFYSQPDANTHLVPTPNPPGAFYPNVISIPFGTTYTPTIGQPGFVSIQVTHYTFNAAPCTYTINPTSAVFGPGGGSGSFTVTTVPGCPINPTTPNGNFITFTVSVNTVNFNVAPFAGPLSRNGAINVAGQSFTIQENGPPPNNDITVTPTRLQFMSNSTTVPPPQSVLIGGGDGQSFSVTVNVPWATVSQSGPTLPGFVTVKVAPDKLAPGSVNSGLVTVTTALGTSSFTVVYIVQGLPSLVPVPASLTFNYSLGGAQPAAQQLKISASTLDAIPISVTGTNYVMVSPSAGNTTLSLSISVDTSKITSAGSFPASVTATASVVTNSPLVVPVTLNVTAVGPVFNAANVVNAASFQPGPMAPGSLFTVFGSLGATSLPISATPTGPGSSLPTSLGGISMTIGGIPVPLEFVSSGQINAQVPFEVGIGSQPLSITANGVTRTVEITTAKVGPGTFLVSGRGAILNQDSSLNGPGNAAVGESTVQVFFTGQGEVTPPVGSGQPASLTQLSFAKATVTATVGSQPADVSFSGLAPGFIGLGQANVKVPTLPANDYPLVLTVNGVPSNSVTVAVRPR